MADSKGRIYLDYSATTPVDPDVVSAMAPYFDGTFGNPSSIHWFGREAKAALEESRETIARIIGATAGEIFFTSGGTEADNQALIGTALAERRLHHKDAIVVSSVEHHAVLHSASYLQELGFEIRIVPVDGTGRVDPQTLDSFLDDSVAVVSVMHSNNEVGTIQPIPQIAAIARSRGTKIHTDAVQSAGKLPLNVDALGVDFLSMSGHKFYAPKGIGALYIRRGNDPDSLIHGGGQERNRRAGTENVALAVGLARALEMSVSSMEGERGRIAALAEMLRESLRSQFDSIVFNGHPSSRLPNIVSISFDSSRLEIDGEALLVNMDLRGVAVTSGSACSSGSMETSHVLTAMGCDPATAKATIRLSLGKYTTETDVAQAVHELAEIVASIGTRRSASIVKEIAS